MLQSINSDSTQQASVAQQTPRLAVLMPNSADAEEAVLGGLLVDPGAIARIADNLPSEAFYFTAHQQIYSAFLHYHKLGQPSDLMVIAAWLQDRKLLDSIGGRSRLIQLFDQTVTAANIDQHVELLLDKFRRRSLLHATQEIQALARDLTLPLEDVTDQSEQKIYALNQSNNPQKYQTIADICQDVFTELEQGVPPGLRTGMLDLDELLGGYAKKQLHIIAARTGMGKSHVMIAMAIAMAKIHGKPIVLFSAEMSKKAVTVRMLALLSGIDSDDLRKGKLEQNQWFALHNAIAELSHLPIHIEEDSNPTPAKMRSVLRRVAMEMGNPPAAVFLDYLQLLSGEGNNRVRELDLIVMECRRIAFEFDLPFFGLAQISRAVEQRQDKRPLMSDLRESGAIESHADTIMLLYRDEYYNEQ
ncbi:MAG: replicative DNA helicase, partial [Leptolyngbyaceae cyanobacterium CSU_1_4]|nr:replicative DNA helicase [Leptolyngbyaceae cyanobacterium CSU_1_4]